MKSLYELLFEISSEERTKILLLLQKDHLRLSAIAKREGFTVAEVSRHLQRLSDTMLIQKDADGLYHLTIYGELTLSMLDGLSFISAKRQYFLEHDAFVLPREFIHRFGELSICAYRPDAISNFAYEEGMFREAEEYVWAMADQVHWSAPPIVSEKSRAGVKFRTIIPENIVPPVGYRPSEGVERRLLPRVDVVVIVTDKEAVFGLTYLKGKMDYAQFASKDPMFRKWCFDLFLHYWDRGKPLVGPFPNLV
jgi:predicted transcriptional regulator